MGLGRALHSGTGAACVGKVSVVIPVYNRERYVKEAVDSALGQTYPDIEVVVVDDCSTDGTADILAGYGDAIRVVRHERNRGVGAAFATGTAAMEGEWFKGLASDDVLYPDAVEQLAGANASLGPNDKVIPFMSMGTVDGRTYPYQPGPMINALDGFGQAVLLLDEFFGVHATCLFRRQLVDRIGFNPEYRAFEDWDFNLRLLLDGYRFVHVERTVYGYRMHGGQMSRAYPGRDEQRDRRRFREMVERALSAIDAGGGGGGSCALRPRRTRGGSDTCTASGSPPTRRGFRGIRAALGAGLRRVWAGPSAATRSRGPRGTRCTGGRRGTWPGHSRGTQGSGARGGAARALTRSTSTLYNMGSRPRT